MDKKTKCKIETNSITKSIMKSKLLKDFNNIKYFYNHIMFSYSFINNTNTTFNSNETMLIN